MANAAAQVVGGVLKRLDDAVKPAVVGRLKTRDEIEVERRLGMLAEAKARVEQEMAAQMQALEKLRVAEEADRAVEKAPTADQIAEELLRQLSRLSKDELWEKVRSWSQVRRVEESVEVRVQPDGTLRANVDSRAARRCVACDAPTRADKELCDHCASELSWSTSQGMTEGPPPHPRAVSEYLERQANPQYTSEQLYEAHQALANAGSSGPVATMISKPKIRG